ncbi:helix-turn-helix domain-containing protein [uncultured Acetatifactor sp.]|jgi:transcriptional regulator with XRE-family HTH domain|uniref:helix-turn-helix domain-containing protein n=1 Tax=uncultured Acetatifactor sp. TaxID=1671927 RepID=UPI002622F18C|nr:helix-turn-helix transcriptional regulator [uncultured Acetatifactor sp.]
MDLKAIGVRIKEAREAKGFTQEQLAEIVGLSPTHMSVIERGVKAPKLETFIKIANALNVTSDSLLLDVLDHSLQIAATELSEQIKHLPLKEQRKILKAVRILAEDDI